MSTLPTDPKERKHRPIASGVLDYFPDALAEVAYCSWVGNEQHNPGERLHWAKEKSTDEPDALIRHLIERGTYDTDGVRHSAKVAWRALALLQREIDAERAAEYSRGVLEIGLADLEENGVLRPTGRGHFPTREERDRMRPRAGSELDSGLRTMTQA